MVCTTIRPTTMRFPEFQTWEGCASFVADHLNYEPLDKPQLLVSDHFSLIKNKSHSLCVIQYHIQVFSNVLLFFISNTY